MALFERLSDSPVTCHEYLCKREREIKLPSNFVSFIDQITVISIHSFEDVVYTKPVQNFVESDLLPFYLRNRHYSDEY